MNVKVMKGTRGKDGAEEFDLFPCEHISVKRVTLTCPAAVSGLAEPGIFIEVCGPGKAHRDVVLPRDGHTVYVTNADGKTIDTYRWPIVPAE